MEKIKSLLHGHKDSGSGEGAETTGTFSQESGHGLLGKSTTPIAAHGLDTSGHAPGYENAHRHGGNAAENAAYRQDMTGEHGHHGHGHRGEEMALGGAGGIAATRGAEDLERDRRGYAGEGGVFGGTHQHGPGLRDEGLVGARGLSSRGGATGLETNDPYMAAGQAGALPGQSGMSGMEREMGAGGMGGAGYGGSQGGLMEGGMNSSSTGGLGGSGIGGMGGTTLGREGETMMGGQGGMGGSTLGREGESMMGGQGMGVGSGVGKEGLIHGHHTTMTGEQLDPHVGGRQL
ncbi:hypothetical protein LTR29_000558 [Friedmanniomyces endolithicus]|nr:hypothetical protein LTR29_000558 [Friedmanniomyces endolithicus]